MKNKAFITAIAIAALSTLSLTGCGAENIPDQSSTIPVAVEQPSTEQSNISDDSAAPVEETETVDSENAQEINEIAQSDNSEEISEEINDSNTEEVKKEVPLVDQRITEVESQEQEQNKRLQKEDITQSEMNHIASTIYGMWDDQLNWMWGEIENKLDADTMETLRTEQNAWIESRNNLIKEAGAEAQGGSMQPMLESTKGAQMTKDRVYELAQWLR